jgi:hypothetical protein
VTTLAGLAGSVGDTDGTNSAARFNFPAGLALDSATNLYVADQVNCTIRKVTPAGTVSTLGGLPGGSGSADGTGSAARFGFPSGVAVDASGFLYVADYQNNTIRKGIVSSKVPPPTLISPRQTASQFGFGMAGFPGLSVNIESSPDLSHWQLVGTYFLVGGTNYFASPTPPQVAQFYRGRAR